MNLYFIPGACSLAVNIALREAGISFALKRVDTLTGRVAGNGDFEAINPKGYVPALQLDEGSVLTETVAVLQYVADRRPLTQLAPPAGTLERYRLMEWLSFINSEVHKGFSPLFSDGATEDVKRYARNQVSKRLNYLERAMKFDYLMGSRFTVADAYLFTVLGWASDVDMDLGSWPRLAGYRAQVGARPHVKSAIQSEG